MKTRIDLKEIERKAYKSTFQDGRFLLKYPKQPQEIADGKE